MVRISILFINSTPEYGGANIQLIEILRHLDLNRYRPVIVNPPQKVQRLADFAQFREPVYTLRLGVIKRSKNPLALIKFAGESAWGVLQISRLIKKEKIKIVHANTSTVISGAIAAKINGLPLIWHVHEVFSPLLIRHFLCRLIMSLADRVVVISKAVRNQFPPKAWPKIDIVYDGIDPEKLKPASSDFKQTVRDKLGINKEAPLIGMVGRFVPWKGQKTFIEACSLAKDEFPAAHFILAGQTFDELKPYTNSLEHLARKLNLANLHFKYWYKDSAELMNILDIVVHASERPEPFGLVVIEAMALEKPVIGTIGGVREIITDDVGLTVPAGDPVALSDAIKNLLINKQAAILMGRRGRKRVEKSFSIKQTVEKINNIYQDLIDRSPSRN